MKNCSVYFLLLILCINTLGAGIGECIHHIDHFISDYHNHVQEKSNYIHKHDDALHEHGFLIEFFSKAFEYGDNDFSSLHNLTLLMLSLCALLSTCIFQLATRLNSLYKFGTGASDLIFNYLDIPTPPPKFFPSPI